MWKYTPRQIASYYRLAHMRSRLEASETLYLAAQAARAKPKEVNATMKKLSKEGSGG